MPYTEQQKKEHIKELQEYLHGIDMNRGKLPAVIPDGIYGNETKEAVRQFQREKGIQPTGDTDDVTWNLIIAEFLDGKVNPPKPLSVFPSKGFVSHKGNNGFVVWTIQIILSELGRRYDNMKKVDVNGEYTDNTAEAVSIFQKIAELKITGEVDIETWNLLINTMEHN